jgi:hypothetical protein
MRPSSGTTLSTTEPPCGSIVFVGFDRAMGGDITSKSWLCSQDLLFRPMWQSRKLPKERAFRKALHKAATTLKVPTAD